MQTARSVSESFEIFEAAQKRRPTPTLDVAAIARHLNDLAEQAGQSPEHALGPLLDAVISAARAERRQRDGK